MDEEVFKITRGRKTFGGNTLQLFGNQFRYWRFRERHNRADCGMLLTDIGLNSHVEGIRMSIWIPMFGIITVIGLIGLYLSRKRS